MITASIRRTADGRSYRVEFPFDRDVVDAIKDLVPPHSRTFDPDEKCWYVAPAYYRPIRDLLIEVFLDVETDAERTTYRPPTANTSRTEYHVLHLRETAPPELVEAAFKCLSKLHHPDRGGSHEQMVAITEAVSIIRRRLAS